ncbi:MAG TPA: 4-alpha-glucanotransferase, partial [Bryobacteraceae bacterium]|nr:4-alpha-glucanotransferase [Bryobacteraceae bacterium]
MPSESLEQLLARAAGAYGLEPGFWDIWGNYHAAPPALQQAVLSAMGVPSGSAEELEKALAERTRREWRRLAPPSVVASESQPRVLPLHVPAESLGERLAVTVRREDGSAGTIETTLEELPQTASLEMDGRTWLRRELRLPDDLPLGYHDISARLGPLTAETRYIVTPDRAWVHPHLGRGGRSAGLAVALYGLRSARNWGCGDFRDLLDLIDWAAAGLHVGFIGLNPLHAIHNRRPFNTSPYLPNSIFYQNFLYLDVEGMEDYARCRRARGLRARPEICAEIEQLRATPLVEYERVSALKLRFLKLCFLQFLREWRAGGPRARAFEAFRAREGDLLDKFAAYCALDEYLHRLDPDCWVWPQWPPEFRDPASPDVRAFQKKHWRSVLFYQYVQWQIDLQLGRAQQRARERGLPLGLYHDLALATDGVGSDLWAHRAFFVPGCRVGSPPDDFSPAGQDWGFPPPRSEHHREDGYRLFAESIRKNCRHGGALRIDHVMRLFRLYWIPGGLGASQGLYVRERSEDYLRVLALESVRNQVVIVGEDLGTVEPAIRETLARFGIFSYRLFYFEKDQRGTFLPGDRYPKQALVSSTTHDLPTLAGFWTGADIEARRQAGAIDEAAYRSQLAARAGEKQKMLDALSSSGLLPPDRPRDAASYPELSAELHNAIIGFLALASSQLLAVNQEDLTKETLQQNLPGTTWQYPNWGRKMRFTLEQLRSDPQT